MTIHKLVQGAETSNWVYSHFSNRQAPQILKRPLQIQMTQQINIYSFSKVLSCLENKSHPAIPKMCYSSIKDSFRLTLFLN